MLRQIVFFCLMISVSSAFSQQQTISALKKNDARTLSALFTEEVDLSFDDQGDRISRADAGQKLESFFASNKIISFAASHSGKAPDNRSFFSIGNAKTAGRTYRVYIKYSVVNGNELVREMRFNAL